MIPLGWRTDLAVLRLGGSLVEEHADHLVVRSPHNPTYRWGNVVLALESLDDGGHWESVFATAFPDAEHRAFGLVQAPADTAGWTEAGLEVDADVVLASAAPVDRTRTPDGYTVRALDGSDWDASLALRVAAFGEESFERASTATRRAMVAAGHTRWFGAFVGDELASELGLVLLDDGVARFQSVVTGPDHRRRGLTRHLLSEAAAWGAEHATRTWVIIAESGSDAERLYRRAGFEAVEEHWGAARAPAPSTDH